MWSIVHEVGALVEIRIWSPVSADEATAWAAEHERTIANIADEYVCFVDLVGATVFPPAAVAAYTAVMKDEPRLRRTAALLGANPVQSLQVDRMMRDADNPMRRAFATPVQVLAWLDPVLGPLERVRLRNVMRQRSYL
ncbi:MAG TPA: hypothetical protein VG755_02460 [Nannocystaceae bacterium]|nr:hypothetical protein [Nannocystaceae bacterium]